MEKKKERYFSQIQKIFKKNWSNNVRRPQAN